MGKGYNLPDDVRSGDPEAPWNDSGEYFQIELSEFIDWCGGRAEILGHDDPYAYMISVQERWIDILLRTYREVGELHPETIQDYVDAITEEEKTV